MNISTMLFSFAGRLNRAPYWLASVGLVVAALVLVMIAFIATGRSVTTIAAAVLLILLSIWITLALTIKRLHDRDKSAWWALLFYVAPFILQVIGARTGSTGIVLGLIGFGISIWALVELGFLRGTAGPNSYGLDPLQVRWSP